MYPRDKVTRGEKIMESLVKKDLLTSSGRDFLIAALDPMHDNQLKDLQGWPDVETSSSVVRLIKQTVQVSAPTGVSGNWDFALNMYPFLCSLAATQYQRSNNYMVQVDTYGRSYGGLCGYGVASGTAISILNQPSVQVTLPDNYSTGAGRIVGMGFEVINTTSQLYKQGNVTVWRQSNGQIIPSDYIVSNTDGAVQQYLTGSQIQSPPLTVSSAMLIPGSRQWAAADGCYVVSPFVGQDNPPKLVDYIQPCVHTDNSVDSTFSASGGVPSSLRNSSLLLCPTGLAATGAFDTVQAQPCVLYPIHQTGAFFQGLSIQTTLTITLNMYLETFPTVSEPDILVLATPSAEYDPLALQIFSHALTVLPVGVPSGWNGFGDWFTDVVSTLSDWLTIPATVFNPAIGAGVAAAGALAKDYRRRNGLVSQPSPNSRPKPLPRTPGKPSQVAMKMAPRKLPPKQNKKK